MSLTSYRAALPRDINGVLLKKGKAKNINSKNNKASSFYIIYLY
jgi:hypothetical protein